MSETCSSSSAFSTKVANLREKLSSVAWVQCDITSCMKWRKVEKAVADKLTGDTWWECSMNKDQRFNACNVPEEDLQSFDKLAQQAKLVVFKSELTPGSLVWAKTPGYCNWPALVSVDPVNGEFWEGDEDEPEKGYYHVEYLGKSHCHLWVYSKSVELFGEGNVTLASQKMANCDKTSKAQQNSRKRKRTKVLCKHVTKKQKRYYGGGSVDLAIKEAVALLPLPYEERLKCCRFVIENDSSFAQSKSEDVDIKQNNITERRGRPSRKQSQTTSKAKHLKKKIRCHESSSKRESGIECDSDDRCSWVSSERKNNISFDFLTSLIDVSKEERFFLDISVYKEKERYFHDNLQKFCSHFGLPIPSSLIWQDTKINLFDLFLAVDDRGGFEEVTVSRQWSLVYFELTNYPSNGGATKAKSAYKKYLYPYELYIKDKDYTTAMGYVKNCAKNSKQTYQTNKPSNEKCTSEIDDGSDMDNAEFMQALNELDDLLQNLKEKDAVVPDLYGHATNAQECCDEEILCAWEARRSSEKYDHHQPITGSQLGTAVEPGESAQVVPEMDFPSISESSTPNEDEMEDGRNLPQVNNEEEWVLQELEALEHDL